MNITSAKFVKGAVGPDEALEENISQIAFLGRSNVGKSSVINSLTRQKDLAKTSFFPGRTRQINIFLVNKAFYFVDLPGYGFAKASKDDQERLQALIYWYLFDSGYEQKKAVLIIDANIGVTENDAQMLHSLAEKNKSIVIVANKVDKIKQSQYKSRLKEIQDVVGDYKVIPFSSQDKIGVSELADEILK
jgi:GTP-binding protein